MFEYTTVIWVLAAFFLACGILAVQRFDLTKRILTVLKSDNPQLWQRLTSFKGTQLPPEMFWAVRPLRFRRFVKNPPPGLNLDTLDLIGRYNWNSRASLALIIVFTLGVLFLVLATSSFLGPTS